MIRIQDYFVLTPRLTPTEAHLLLMAWWHGEEPDETQLYRIQGEIVGPLCEYATTLHTRGPLQPDRPMRCQPLHARATILEPCFWEPEHPFCYEINLELHGADGLLDMRRIITGIRHLEVDGNELLLNGQSYSVSGVQAVAGNSIAELESWHDAGCGAFVTHASNSLCERTDRWGPMVLHNLTPANAEDVARQVAQLRRHPSLLVWVLPAGLSGEPLQVFTEAIRKLDPTRPIGRLVVMDETTDSLDAVDLLLLPIGHPDIAGSALAKPFIVIGHGPPATPESFADRLAELRDTVGSPPGLVGVMLGSD